MKLTLKLIKSKMSEAHSKAMAEARKDVMWKDEYNKERRFYLVNNTLSWFPWSDAQGRLNGEEWGHISMKKLNDFAADCIKAGPDTMITIEGRVDFYYTMGGEYEPGIMYGINLKASEVLAGELTIIPETDVENTRNR